MGFLVDAQLPPGLARWLAANGHEATHVSDLGLPTASDPAIWDHALAVSSVIVTKDEDFAAQGIGPITGRSLSGSSRTREGESCLPGSRPCCRIFWQRSRVAIT
jgi:uncharacterized protein DUF5615